VGILIGVFVNIIFQVIANFNMDWKDMLTTFVVSIIITLCIANISVLSDAILNTKFRSPVANIVIYYILVFIGVVTGTEISILFITLLYDVPFNEVDQVKNLTRNLGLGCIVGTIIYIYQLQRDNYKLKLAEKELQMAKLSELKTNADLKTLQARINPHFLYNALNSIASLIHESPDKAEEMVIKLSQLFRYSINTQEANWSTVKDELQIVNIYLDIERVRFGNRIVFETSADESVINARIPRFLIQPLVENALKHGLKNKNESGLLKVHIKDNQNTISIEIHDNGDPFPQNLLAGYGLQSTSDKLNLLYGDSYAISFVNTPLKMIVIQLPKS